MLTKVCKKCGIEKSEDEFYKRKDNGNYRLECKVCNGQQCKKWRVKNQDYINNYHKRYYIENINEIRKKQKEYHVKNIEASKEYQKTYYIENSELAKVSAREYYYENITNIRKYQKEYGIKNAKRKIERQKEYYNKNIEHYREQKKEYHNSLARYNDSVQKINFAEETKNNNGLLEVRCTYCNKWFSPINSQLKSRVATLSGRMSGENRFYCSEDCKKACPIYRQKKYEKGIKIATSREVPAEFRKIALEDRNYTCEKCGSIENGLHVHHIEGYTEQPMFMADLSNVIVVCKKCHKEIHKQKGCSYQDYQCANKNKSLLDK